MHRLFFTAALGVGLLAFVGTSRAFAFGSERVDAHVPFAFHVDGTRLPPGNYLIQQADIEEPMVVSILSRTTGQKLLFLTDNASPDKGVNSPQLVFDTYGNQKFLHAIWLPDESGAVLHVSPAEVYAARVAAANATPTGTASTAMSR